MRIICYLLGCIVSLAFTFFLIHDIPVDLKDFSNNRMTVPVFGLAIGVMMIAELCLMPSAFGAYRDAKLNWLPNPSSLTTCLVTGIAWPPIIYGIWWLLAPAEFVGIKSAICALLTLVVVYYLTAIGPLRVGKIVESK